MLAQASRYTVPVETGSRRLVSRICRVCDWEGASVETAPGAAIDCPWCHAPTQVVREEWLTPKSDEKNPHAAALGRIGGAKGGRIRAKRLGAGRRREIARKAAQARWRRR
jgi:hypothetical protein